MRKPESCKPCPLYDDGEGYVPDDLVEGAETFVMMQNPGPQEEIDSKPAVGKSGEYMDTVFLPLAQLERGKNVSVGNVLKCRWRNPKKGTKTNDLPSAVGIWNPDRGKYDKTLGLDVERQAASHCLNTLTQIPSSTKLVVAQGDLAWEHLTGKTDGITRWRGFLSLDKGHTLTKWRGLPVFGTFHTAYTLQTPRMTIPVMSDWKKVRGILNHEWPRAVPYRNIHNHLVGAPDGTVFCTIDTEFDPDTYKVWLIGVAYWGAGVEPLGGEQIYTTTDNIPSIGAALLRLITRVPVVAWNVIAELLSIKATFGISPEQYLQYEDPMQIHALLQSEWPHDLGFVESMHGLHNRMKHLEKEDPLLYNWGDCLTAGYAFKDLMRQQGKDPLSFRVYREQNLPLVKVRYDAKRLPIALDRHFLAELSGDLARRITYAQEQAEAYTGFPLNLGSHPQFTGWLQDVEGFKLKKGKEREGVTADKDAIAELRREFYDFDPEEEKDGITPEMLDRNVGRGAHPLLEARAMYQNANQLFKHFVVPLSMAGVSLDGTNVLTLQPEDFVQEVHPDQHTHTQASGRWSTVRPPLPTLPKKLRKMLRPPQGRCMVKYDADQQELRLNAHLAHDEPTLEVFRAGHDIHTINTCDVFTIQLPPDPGDPHKSPVCEIWRVEVHWEGKDDKRRVFCKRFVYRLIYRGDPRFAGDIPGSKAIGLTQAGLVEASKNYLAKHPALPIYWARNDTQVRATRIVRSFRGRKRFLNGAVTAKAGIVPPAMREGTNHPIQSGGVDWCNLTILTVLDECRDLLPVWGFGAHDSHTWLVPLENEVIFRERVKEITDRPWDVEGRPLVLPVELDPTIYPL